MTEASILERLSPDGWVPPAIIAAETDAVAGDLTLRTIHGAPAEPIVVPASSIPWGAPIAAAMKAASDAPDGTILVYRGPGRPGLDTLPSSAIQAACGRMLGLEGDRPWFAFHPSHARSCFAIALIGQRLTQVRFYELLSHGRDRVVSAKPTRLAKPMVKVGEIEIPSGALPRIAREAGLMPGREQPGRAADRRRLWVSLFRHLRHTINPQIQNKLAFPEVIADAGKIMTIGIPESEFRDRVRDLLMSFPSPNGIRALSMTTPTDPSAWSTKEACYKIAQSILHQDAGADIDPDAYKVACALIAAAKPYGRGPKSGGDINLMLASDMLGNGIFWLERLDEDELFGHEQMAAGERLVAFLRTADIEENARKRALAALGAAD